MEQKSPRGALTSAAREAFGVVGTLAVMIGVAACSSYGASLPPEAGGGEGGEGLGGMSVDPGGGGATAGSSGGFAGAFGASGGFAGSFVRSGGFAGMVESAGGSAGMFGSSGGDVGAGGFVAGGQGGGAAGSGPANACQLTFVFTTVDNHGNYSPNNVSAVWVTNSQSQFVRTLEENGRRRQSHLTQWEASSRGVTVDAVTGATNTAPRVHTASWDCNDKTHGGVPPGTYTVHAEFATGNSGTPPSIAMPFQVGSGPETLQLPDAKYFTSISLNHQ
ncbi:MAG TPA: DUF2271 domain-containing protein [Polyangiaceae bacterium]